MIPRLTHQTWKQKALTREFATYRQSWVEKHPEWEHRFYDDRDCRAFIEDDFPEWLDIFDGFSRPIQRFDLFRYLVIYRHGGLYIDMDMQCLKPVDRLLAGKACVLSVERILTKRYQSELGYKEPFQIANCVFAAAPGHAFLNRILERIRQVAERPALSDDDVEEITGPRMLTRVYHDLPACERADLHVLPKIFLVPPKEYPNLFPVNMNMHARHHAAGTWKNRRQTSALQKLQKNYQRVRWPSPW